MRFRGLLAAVIVLAALGGAAWWSERREKVNAGKPSADAPPKILSIPEGDFQQIQLAKKGGDTTLLKKAGGKWQIVQPKPLAADQDSVNSLVTSLSSLSSDRLIEDKASDLSSYGLNSPAEQVAVTRKDGKVQTLLVGDDTPTGAGVFAKLESDPRVFTIASFAKSSLDKSSKDLRDKRLLTFNSDKLTRVDLSAKGTYEFGKNNQNEWQILKPRPLRADGLQVDDLRKDKDKNFYARSSAVEGIYKVSNDLGDGLDKGLDDFRNKKLFDFGWNDPSKLEVHNGAAQASYQKNGEKWMSGPKQMDAPSIQALVDKLRDLTSVKFLDAGYGPVVFEASVTANGGKRVEKVAIWKQGASYYARREGEPTVYELDTKAVEDMLKVASEVKEFQPPKSGKK